MTSLGHPDCF
jgi:hypothetical protein